MCTVKNNLETIVFPLTLKQNKILKQFQQIWTPWEAILLWYDFYENQRRLIFCRSERVKLHFISGLKFNDFIKHSNKITLWRRQTKSLLIFVKLLQLVPQRELRTFRFFEISLYLFQRYVSFFGIFKSACLFENLSLQKIQCL